MIVVATADFELYHDVVAALRDREATFTTVRPASPVPAETTAVIAAPDDEIVVPESADAPPVLTATATNATRVVEEALLCTRSDTEATAAVDDRVVVGVDPGKRPGIAVLIDDTVVAAHQVPRSEAPGVIDDATDGVADPLVRIGDGARLHSARLIDAIEDVPIELVDETGTTPTLGPGAGGAGDIVAAINIAHRSGEPVSSRDIDPTAGELKQIKQRAREHSPQNRALPDRLARRVAAGELTLQEALATHAADD